jgi:hypothetical protein
LVAVDRATFEQRLREAARSVVLFARDFVCQALPDEVDFRVYPNQSFDGNPRVGDEVVFPAETLPEGGFHGPWSAEQAAAFLCREGKVPEWIDAAVEAEDGNRSLIALRCCGRFTASEELLYHRAGGLAPFSLKSPVLPPGWQSVEASGRFDLHWRQSQSWSSPWWRFW